MPSWLVNSIRGMERLIEVGDDVVDVPILRSA
jgi:hypothetical protein